MLGKPLVLWVSLCANFCLKRIIRLSQFFNRITCHTWEKPRFDHRQTCFSHARLSLTPQLTIPGTWNSFGFATNSIILQSLLLKVKQMWDYFPAWDDGIFCRSISIAVLGVNWDGTSGFNEASTLESHTNTSIMPTVKSLSVQNSTGLVKLSFILTQYFCKSLIVEYIFHALGQWNRSITIRPFCA